jgi:hypothetical protein
MVGIVTEMLPQSDGVGATASSGRRRKRTKRLPRYVYDRRFALGRRVKTLEGIFKARLGDEVASDPITAAAIRRCAETIVLAEDLRARALRGEDVSPDDVLRMTRAADALTRRLHLDRHKPSGEPTLADILREAS